MKTNNEKIEQYTEATLKLLEDNTGAPEADPYFYTRLMAHIDSRQPVSGYRQFKAAYLVPALLVLLLLLNILTYMFIGSNTSTNTGTQNSQNIYLLPGDYSSPTN